MTTRRTDARQRNRELLRESYSLGAEDLALLLRELGFGDVNASMIRFTVIDAAALHACEAQWAGHPDRKHDWDWRAERIGYRSRSKSFELAVWHGDTLCALCVGEYKRNRTHLNLNLLEGNPDPHHPLRGCVRYLTVHVAETFCEVVPIRALWLVKPINAKVAGLYEDMGFALAKRPDGAQICVKELSP